MLNKEHQNMENVAFYGHIYRSDDTLFLHDCVNKKNINVSCKFMFKNNNKFIHENGFSEVVRKNIRGHHQEPQMCFISGTLSDNSVFLFSLNAIRSEAGINKTKGLHKKNTTILKQYEKPHDLQQI